MVGEGEIAALGAALCWTVSAVLYKKALLNVKPVAANIVRCAFTSLILLVFLALCKNFWVPVDLSSNALVLACISGLLGLGLGDTFYLASLKLIGVARAVSITCTYPLFSLLWAMTLGGENIMPSTVIGTIIIVFGIWLLSQDKLNSSTTTSRKILVKGVALAIATAMIWSISISMMNMAIKETQNFNHAWMLNIIRITAVAIFLLVSVPLTDKELSFLKIQREAIYTIGAGGVIALGLGWFFLTYSFAVATPESRAVPISSTTPLFSTLSGIIFLHEKVTKQSISGSILIVVGIFLIFME
jgi:DME family drug/metabolite transporter